MNTQPQRPSIGSSPEWSEYSTRTTRDTFAPLRKLAKQQAAIPEVLSLMMSLWADSRRWRVAQHLALLFNEIHRPIEAWYYSEQAEKATGGNLYARVQLASAYCRMGMPDATLHMLRHISRPVKNIADAARRITLRQSIAEMQATAYLALGDTAKASRWIIYLEHHPTPKFPLLRDVLILTRTDSSRSNVLVTQANLLQSGSGQMRRTMRDLRQHQMRQAFVSFLARARKP